MSVFFFQKKLHALSAESESLSSEIAQRKDLLEKIEAEDKVVTKVRETDNNILYEWAESV